MTTLAKLRFFFNLVFYVLPIAGFRIIGAIVRGWMKRLPLGLCIWNGFSGALMANTPPKQFQAILPSTIEAYNTWALSHGNKSKVDVLAADGSTRLLWIGPKQGNKVVLFLHGKLPEALFASGPGITKFIIRWRLCDATFQSASRLDGACPERGVCL